MIIDKPKQKTLEPPFQAICINNHNRPKEIPLEKWLTLHKEYTIIKVCKTLDNQVGFIVEGIELGEDTKPYDLFSAKRFGILAESTASEVAEEAVDNLIEEIL